MEVGDVVKVKVGNNHNEVSRIYRKYEVLKIYQKRLHEQDLVLCRDLKNDCKECFQRFDLRYAEVMK